jgi:hypothetical protein
MRVVKASSRMDLLLHRVLAFYEDPEMARVFVKLINRRHDISLRLIDWLVTNYAKKHEVILTPRENGVCREFHVYLSYKACLRAFSKRQFDPFARRERVTVVIGGFEVQTTVAQMCFFRWCLTNDVLAYALGRRDDIERDMLESIAHRNAVGDASKPKRRVLSNGRGVARVRVVDVSDAGGSPRSAVNSA